MDEPAPAEGIAAAEPGLRALMLQALDGDRTAYAALLLALGDRLRGYFRTRMAASPDEVEDLVQETLLAIHEKRHTYRHSEPLTPWVFAIARYKLLRQRERSARRVTAPLDEAVAVGDPRNPEEPAIRHDIRRLLSALPGRQRRLLAAIKLGGASVADTARQEGMSDGAVKVSVHRGLRALMARVRDED